VFLLLVWEVEMKGQIAAKRLRRGRDMEVMSMLAVKGLRNVHEVEVKDLFPHL